MKGLKQEYIYNKIGKKVFPVKPFSVLIKGKNSERKKFMILPERWFNQIHFTNFIAQDCFIGKGFSDFIVCLDIFNILLIYCGICLF